MLSGKEYQALLVQCADHLKPMVVLAYMTGMRKGEIVKLRWDQVRFKERVIILEAEDTKTHQKREIPLNDELLNMLGRVPRLMNSLEVFSYRGRAYRSDGVRKMTEFERHLTRLFGGLRSRGLLT